MWTYGFFEFENLAKPLPIGFKSLWLHFSQ